MRVGVRMGMGGDVLFFFLIRCSLFLSEEKKKIGISFLATRPTTKESLGPRKTDQTLFFLHQCLYPSDISLFTRRKGKEKKKRKKNI